MTRFSLIISSIFLAVLLAGCTSFGAGTISGDKEDFTDSISESIKVQMLRNIA